MRFRRVLVPLLTIFCLPWNSAAEKTAADSVSEGASPYWGHSFDSSSQKIILGTLLTSAASHQFDTSMRQAWVDHQRMNESTAQIGDLLGTGIPGLVIGLSQLSFDQKGGVAHLKSWVAAGLWTHGLKIVVGRKRPGTSENRQSWPSGHTSTLFASASALGLRYGWRVGLPMTMLAAGTGFSRLADDAHWLSDVVAGAGIGLWMGYAYAEASDRCQISQVLSPENQGQVTDCRSDQDTWMLVPSVGNETVLFTLMSNF